MAADEANGAAFLVVFVKIHVNNFAHTIVVLGQSLLQVRLLVVVEDDLEPHIVDLALVPFEVTHDRNDVVFVLEAEELIGGLDTLRYLCLHVL